MTSINAALFGERAFIKATLTTLMPSTSPSDRLEIFARECGYRSDAAFQADATDRAPLVDDGPFASAQSTLMPFYLASFIASARAAEGFVLPFLVLTAARMHTPTTAPSNSRTTARPQPVLVADLLKEAIATVDRGAYQNALRNPCADVVRTAEGPARWFYAVATSAALLSNPTNGDTFWTSKGRQFLCGWLAMARLHNPDDPFTPEMIAKLAMHDPNALSPWERAGRTSMIAMHHSPDKTRASILATVEESLPGAIVPTKPRRSPPR